jgi:lipoate-protein ligase A
MTDDDVGAAVVTALARCGLPYCVEPACGDPQRAIDRDETLFREACGDANSSPFLRIWENDRCLVATRRQRRSTFFVDACRAAHELGWPVVVRASGGTTVVNRPGILNVSLTCVVDRSESLGATYERLLMLLTSAVAGIGIACTFGFRLGTPCDGEHNLLTNGRKLAGTAMLTRPIGARSVRLVHSAMTVAGSIEQDIAAITSFERAMGLDIPYDPSLSTSLAAARSASASTKGVPAP